MLLKIIRKSFWLILFVLLQWVMVPAASADINSLGFGTKGGPQFIQDIGDNFYAQTSEVTITLEKKMPPSIIPQKDAPEAMGDTAANTGIRSGHKTELYEDLEDPFATMEELPELNDPFEGYNRFMYGVNESLYDNVMEPVARGYRAVVTEDIRIVISNLFDNAMFPVKFVSSLIQGDFEKAGRVLGRTLINTTVGLGGMLDVAGQEYGIKNVNEDFDQALGYHGIPTGPYVVLPLLGPATIRSIAGRTVDSFLSPGVILAPGFSVGAGISVSETINDTSFIIEDLEQLEEGAIDEYESVRDFYHQYRFGLQNE